MRPCLIRASGSGRARQEGAPGGLCADVRIVYGRWRTIPCRSLRAICSPFTPNGQVSTALEYVEQPLHSAARHTRARSHSRITPCDSLVSRCSPFSPRRARAPSSPRPRPDVAAADRTASRGGGRARSRVTTRRRDRSGADVAARQHRTGRARSRAPRRARRSPSAGSAGSCTSRRYGTIDYAAGAPAVDPTTLYDLASLTKVVATTTAAMILEEEGKLDLVAHGAELSPRVRRARQGGRSPCACCSRTAAASRRSRRCSRQWRGRAEYLAQINARPLANPPGTKMIYSDWDFVLLR